MTHDLQHVLNNSDASTAAEEANRVTVAVDHDEGYSSGLVIDDHHALTDVHQFSAPSVGDEVQITTADGKTHEAEIVGFAQGDEAVLQTGDHIGQFAAKIATHDSHLGDRVTCVEKTPLGSGGEDAVLVHAGAWSGEDPTASGDALVTGAALKEGLSGSPIVDDAGQVVGMNMAANVDEGGDVGIAIDARTIREVISALKHDELSTEPSVVEYPPGQEPIASQSEVDAAKRAAEQAKNDEYHRRQELEAAKNAKWNAEHGIV